MSIEATFVHDEHAAEFGPLSALANILRRGAFGSDEVKLLSAVACDVNAELGMRYLAQRSINWLLTADLNGIVSHTLTDQ